MARRIRSIKPEILDDEVTAALPHLEWRLFVSLWLLSDDYGNLHGRAAQIKGSALWKTPDTEAKVREALARLSHDRLIRFYEVRGQSYVHICGWAKHQKVDHPGKRVIPAPSDDSRDSRETLGDSAETLALDQDQGSGPGEDQGAAAPTLAPVKVDHVAALWAEQERLRREALPKSRGLALTADRRKAIGALLKAGHTPESLTDCLRVYAAEARSTGGQWFDGVSNWRPDNVTRTLGKVGTKPPTAPANGGRFSNDRPQPAPMPRPTAAESARDLEAIRENARKAAEDAEPVGELLAELRRKLGITQPAPGEPS